jgi:hypothetical protein
MATEGANESAHAFTQFAFVKNRTTARVVSSPPRRTSVVSGSGGNCNYSYFNNFFNLKISAQIVLEHFSMTYFNYI